VNRNNAAASGTGIFHFLPFHEMPHEHWMVHELRQRRWIGSLSFTAELEDRTVIGHIICSNAVVKKENQPLPVLNFGPLSVLSKYQRQGIESACAGDDRTGEKEWLKNGC